MRTEITLAATDLWLLLSLRSFIVDDARHRGTPINRRYKVLPQTLHAQYETLNTRFERRVAALELDKAPALDLARRLMLEEAQAEAQANGMGRDDTARVSIVRRCGVNG